MFKSKEQWKAVYSVYRAMHDSTCPNCGCTKGDFHARATMNPIEMLCSECGFYITAHECEAIREAVAMWNNERITPFLDWRENH